MDYVAALKLDKSVFGVAENWVRESKLEIMENTYE